MPGLTPGGCLDMAPTSAASLVSQFRSAKGHSMSQFVARAAAPVAAHRMGRHWCCIYLFLRSPPCMVRFNT
jgi:hypothetical protein